MLIGIISDTHMGKHPEKIVELCEKYLNDVELILHAGDYKGSKVVNLLKQQKNFVGVWGNVDDQSVRKILKEKEIIPVEGHRIGLFHGHGDDKDTPERAYDKFKDDNVDIIVFGHSHQAQIFTRNKVLMINPGSPTSRRRERWRSYVLLRLDENGIGVELKFLP